MMKEKIIKHLIWDLLKLLVLQLQVLKLLILKILSQAKGIKIIIIIVYLQNLIPFLVTN
jgi:hypothetical protein